MNNRRNYYFDILRIIAMCMIIIHHITINDFGLQPNLIGGVSILSFKQMIILIFINSFAIIGVNLFFLISGYFKIKFSFKKFISLILQVYIVFDVVTLIGVLTGYLTFNKDLILKLLFPIDLYWFIGAYIALMLLSPFLNKIIDNIKKDDKKIILLILLLFSLYAFKHDGGLVINGGYSLIWATVMYVTGGIINKFEIKNKKGILLYILSALILSLIGGIYYKLGMKEKTWNLFKYNNILILIESIGIFVWANSLSFKIKNKNIINIINFLGKNTLMVYLLHSTCWLTVFRKIPIINLTNLGYFKVGIILLPIYALIIYIVCALISILYNKVIQNIINKMLSKKVD